MAIENEAKKESVPTEETDKIYRQNLKAELEEIYAEFKTASEAVKASQTKILELFSSWATVMKSDLESELWEKISQERIIRIGALTLHAEIFNRIEFLKVEIGKIFAADAMKSGSDGKITLQ